MEDTIRFLGELYRGQKGYIEVRILYPKENYKGPKTYYNGKTWYHSVRKPEKIVGTLAKLRELQKFEPFQVYFGVHPRIKPKVKASKADNVFHENLRILFLDLDVLHGREEEMLRRGTKLAKYRVLEVAAKVKEILVKAGITPFAIVYTGLGAQVFIKLSEGVNAEKWEELQGKLVDFTQRELEKIGIDSIVDGLDDLPRIVRAPGTFNTKVALKALAAKGQYTKADIIEALKKYAIPTEIFTFTGEVTPVEAVEKLKATPIRKRSSGGNLGGSALVQKASLVVQEGYELSEKSINITAEKLAKALGPNPDGIRHNAMLFISGWFYHRKIHFDSTVQVIFRIAEHINDEELEDRIAAAVYTYAKDPTAEKIGGKQKLIELIQGKYSPEVAEELVKEIIRVDSYLKRVPQFARWKTESEFVKIILGGEVS